MTTVRGRITGAHRDANNGVLEHKVFVQLLPEDGCAGWLTVNVSPVVYEKFARNFPSGPFEVEVNLLFDKPPST